METIMITSNLILTGLAQLLIVLLVVLVLVKKQLPIMKQQFKEEAGFFAETFADNYIKKFLFYELPTLKEQATEFMNEYVQETFIGDEENKGLIYQVVDQVMGQPIVKQGMSLMGKQSGMVRAESGIIDKFNENFKNVSPAIGAVAEQLNMDASELLAIWNDPMLGKTIQGFIMPLIEKGLGKGQLPGKTQQGYTNAK